MSEGERPALTARQRYWLDHVQACEVSGKTMAEYAAEQGLAVHTMYAGKKRLFQKGVLPRARPGWFQQVQGSPN